VSAERGKDAPSILLPNQDAEYVRHIAIDIGGSLIKLVYFLPDEGTQDPGSASKSSRHTGGRPFPSQVHPLLSFGRACESAVGVVVGGYS
jgi:hypothetical protein